MTTLYRYRLFQLPDGTYRALGYDVRTADPHLSLPLVTFDTEARRGVAADGTVYELQGEPTLDMNAGWTWAYYCAEHGIEHYTVVSLKRASSV